MSSVRRQWGGFARDFSFCKCVSESSGVKCINTFFMVVDLQQRVPDIPILRVNQIDAARLDVEMTAMLREQLGKVFSLSQVCSGVSLLSCWFLLGSLEFPAVFSGVFSVLCWSKGVLFSDIFPSLQPGLLLRYEPELNAFLEFLVWRFSIWVDKPTPGNALMNLRYRNERSYKAYLNVGRGQFNLDSFKKACYMIFIWFLSSVCTEMI